MASSGIALGVKLVRLGLEAVNAWKEEHRDPLTGEKHDTTTVRRCLDIAAILLNMGELITSNFNLKRVLVVSEGGVRISRVIVNLSDRKSHEKLQWAIDMLAFLRLHAKYEGIRLDELLAMSDDELSKVKWPIYETTTEWVGTEPITTTKQIGTRTITRAELKGLAKGKETAISSFSSFESACRGILAVRQVTEGNPFEGTDDLINRDVIPHDLADDATFTVPFPDPRTGNEITLSCSLTHRAIRYPVQDECGHIFEKDAIAHYLRFHTSCPVTNTTYTIREVDSIEADGTPATHNVLANPPVERPDLQRVVDARLHFYQRILMEHARNMAHLSRVAAAAAGGGGGGGLATP